MSIFSALYNLDFVQELSTGCFNFLKGWVEKCPHNDDGIYKPFYDLEKLKNNSWKAYSTCPERKVQCVK